MGCEQFIEKEACVQARVKVFPETEAGRVKFECVGEPKREPCDRTLCPECDFMISQMICLKIPIEFSADAVVLDTGIVCENKHKECKRHPCDDKREHEVIIIRRVNPESEPERSFARNYLLTYQNNPEH